MPDIERIQLIGLVSKALEEEQNKVCVANSYEIGRMHGRIDAYGNALKWIQEVKEDN